MLLHTANFKKCYYLQQIFKNVTIQSQFKSYRLTHRAGT